MIRKWERLAAFTDAVLAAAAYVFVIRLIKLKKQNAKKGSRGCVSCGIMV